jgi:hypothetical protein
LLGVLLLLLSPGCGAWYRAACAQQPLDPVRDAAGAPLERDIHRPLSEQYIWIVSDASASNADRIQTLGGAESTLDLF